jgi:uncharacterized protein (DUF488 family)
MKADPVTIYTVGHGRHPFDYFLELLTAHQIALVCDVRSIARSRWPQFNWRVLEVSLKENSIGYEHLPECGGKIIAKTDDFWRGIDRILELAAEMRIALMCSESQPLTNHVVPRANCHRIGTLAPPLISRGASMIHILPNGTATTFDERAVPSFWM